METLGLIDENRLALVPNHLRVHHEFCFHLHDQMLELLVQYEGSGAHQWVIDGLEEVLRRQGKATDSIDIFELLRQTELIPLYKHHIVCHLVFGLVGDMLSFLYESFRCFEKRKFSVAFSLLRKPLKENLLFLSWLLSDEDDFIHRFEKNNYQTLNGITVDQRKNIFSRSIEKLQTSEAFSADVIEELLFSKTSSQGFEPIWQRATHLITSQGASLRTEDLNLNFVFLDAREDYLYEHLYRHLPYIMLYAIQTALECFARLIPSNELTSSHLIITSMGAYESLYQKKRTGSMTKMLGQHLRPFLVCLHCEGAIRLSRKNAIMMYLRELVVCGKCNLPSPLPLYWIFSQAKFHIVRKSQPNSILSQSSSTESA